jgi:hypothetical protein
LPGEAEDSSFKQLSATSNGVDVDMVQLLSAVQHRNGNYAGVAGRDTASALGEFTKTVRGVAATSKNLLVINASDEVIESCETHINPRQILGVIVDSLAMSETPENSAAKLNHSRF